MDAQPNALKQLADATDRLAALIATEPSIDVFVPLYANTFPLATVAKRARLRSPGSDIAIRSFDWGWNGAWSRDGREPPFVSAKRYQLFFATEAEFPGIHAAGISFCAIPVSVFHPKFIFIGLPAGSRPRNSAGNLVTLVQGLIADALSRQPVQWPQELAEITWISDIPSQAAPVARAIHERLHPPVPDLDVADFNAKLVKFWQSRTLQECLGFTQSSVETNKPAIKAFIWGGPLASAAQHDVQRPRNTGWLPRQYPLGWPRLRDWSRPCAVVRMDDLVSFLQPPEIRLEHGLYCCIGYKEDRKLLRYYLRQQEGPDWDPYGGKVRAAGQPVIGALTGAIREFFGALFQAAEQVSQQAMQPPEVERTLFSEFRSDYDKYCRTINPVAQIYTADEYAKCLREHHDGTSFGELYEKGSLTESSPRVGGLTVGHARVQTL